ncbi:Clavaminate synthase-like protein [Schizopora paradoxa]|uniref:Clavaminate synthase-like protein n=1 Tax=Schizopora paradoxa TaxID=27342 RepID=A0A0H2RPV3_9AGAM|nr:Clavaminate synthase-like protein [Schizopora paradoxa]
MAVSSVPLKLRTLPIIDISPFLHPEDEHFKGHNGGRAATAASLHSACLTYGFFYLDISSYAEQKEMEELSELGRKFFSLDDDVKARWSLENQDGARGYQRLKQNVTNGKADNHEGFDFYAPIENPDKSKPLWGENQWPDDGVVPGFRTKFEKWIDKMKNLGLIVMEAMSLGLGMSEDQWKDLRSKVDDSFWVMRIIGYPPLPNDYDGFSCGAHNFLYADPTPNALQVFLTKEDVLDDKGVAPIPVTSTTGLAPSTAKIKAVEQGVWINADPIPGCIVCNIGESGSFMWEIWTNGLYKSTLHRVIHRGSNYRIPFFFEPNFNAHITPLPAALRLQEGTVQPAYNANGVYEPVVYGEFLTKKVANNFDTGKGRYD